MKKHVLSLAVVLFAFAAFAINLDFNQYQLIFADAIYAPLDDEENKEEDCLKPDMSIGTETTCKPGNTDCTPTLCQ